MKPTDRLELAAQAIKQYNPHQIESIEDFSVEDLAKVSADQGISAEQMPKMIGMMIYIRQRLVNKLSRVKAFEIAFPERCVVSDSKAYIADAGKYSAKGKPGDKLSLSSIDIKAKRLENSHMYMSVYTLLQTNMYVSYAVDRMKVLDEALTVALDPMTPLREKDRYMKLFLEETRKPDSAKAMEFNVNVNNNTVNIASVEDRMNTIAQALNHATAAEVIDIVHQGRPNDSE